MSSWTMPAGWKGAFQEREHEQRPWERCCSIKFEFVMKIWGVEKQERGKGHLLWILSRRRELGFILWGTGSSYWALRWQVT